jgi:hypothetical protein
MHHDVIESVAPTEYANLESVQCVHAENSQSTENPSEVDFLLAKMVEHAEKLVKTRGQVIAPACRFIKLSIYNSFF